MILGKIVKGLVIGAAINYGLDLLSKGGKKGIRYLEKKSYDSLRQKVMSKDVSIMSDEELNALLSIADSSLDLVKVRQNKVYLKNKELYRVVSEEFESIQSELTTFRQKILQEQQNRKQSEKINQDFMKAADEMPVSDELQEAANVNNVETETVDKPTDDENSTEKVENKTDSVTNPE